VTPLERGRKSGAILGLGSLAHERGLAEGERQRVEKVLRDGLGSAHALWRISAYLGGIGNTHDPAMAEVVLPFLDAPQPNLATQAWRAARNLDRLPDQGHILAAWRAAQDPALQGAIADGLSGNVLEASHVGECIALLQDGPSLPRRQVLIALLGSVASTNEHAKAALQAAFVAESDGHVLVQLGRYLRPEDVP